MFRITTMLLMLLGYVHSAAAQVTASSVDTNASGTTKRQVHLIYMGGNDCPPCVAWRRSELPKLQETEAFKAIKFSYVVKSIGSPIPSSFFLPAEVKPLKPMLEEASRGFGGSPQFALVVDGKIHDYYWGTWDAETTEKMLISALTGSKYPHASRCVQYGESSRVCKQSIKTQ